ncbi:MAG TPA: aconitate hydratase AcnA [Actinomycetota bacterium]|nr:aconitate hydratase AcnA [Actinomycetota bacterium]
MTATDAHDDAFGARGSLDTPAGAVALYRLAALEDAAGARLELVPMTVKVILENLLRMIEDGFARPDDVANLARWGQGELDVREFAYSPARVILQDFTGVPAVVDLAAMRSALRRAGGDPARVDPLVPVDLVIDHSVQVDAYASANAYTINVEREYERNHERYSLLRWAQQAFRGFRVVPPGMGIVHQVNLEHLATVTAVVERGGRDTAIFDTLVGTDSHTPMVNGLGVLGWGVGGIEAEAAMLGQPLPMITPTVVGFKFTGELQTGVTATDLVLTVTEMLRAHGVVGKFVEFYGHGLSSLAVADRATLSNMSPEYGATAALWPVDEQTLKYLRLTGRDDDRIALVERYAKEQGAWRTDDTPDPVFNETLELDLTTVEPSVAGPRRPQDRVPLGRVLASFEDVFERDRGDGVEVALERGGGSARLRDGSVVIAAITSCTNTSNPSVMLGAALLAKKAVERGLDVKPWVKTSLAPGSRVVTEYLEGAGLVPYLEKLGFGVVGYGCTTCIGNSGPLDAPIAEAIDEHDLAVVSVLSGNRNFEGRIHPQVRASYLASPLLVVAYALAGHVEVDLTSDPLGDDADGNPVYLRDVWPSTDEITEAMAAVRAELFTQEYAKVFEGDEHWAELPSPTGDLYEWDPESTYVREPPFFTDLGDEPGPVAPLEGARVLAFVGDSVTTDHISPAGSIAPSSPAGKYLRSKDVAVEDFNSYGSRRGNHEVMVRGTFANIRIRNALADGKEGGYTKHLPSGEVVPIFDAAERYAEDGTPLIVLAGKEYGSGSSRDWAAKGSALLGVRAVIAESFERIHRSNLIALGVLPLQFSSDESVESLGLTGRETFTIRGLGKLDVGSEVVVEVSGGERRFTTRARFDAPAEVRVYRAGGLLQMMMRQLAEAPAA